MLPCPEGSDHYDFLRYFLSSALVLTAIQLVGQSSIYLPLYRNKHFAKTSEKETLLSKPSSHFCVYTFDLRENLFCNSL